jgi:hypothetical protein
MHIWTSLAAREAAFLLILLLMGSGPASFLSDRFDAASRIGLAPALGFCLGTCVTTTLLQFTPTNNTYWILVPLALGSAAVAAVRTWRTRGRDGGWRARLPVLDVAALVLIGVAVTGPLNGVLHKHHTVGPGAYYFTDVDNYAAIQDAARTVSLHTANQHWKAYAATGDPGPDFTQFTWAFFAQFGSNLDATPLDSNVNALLGLGATDTFAPFLTVLMLMGGLGGFVAVRYFTRSRTIMAVAAGCLFGGSLFLELWFDSFQAAILAIGLLVPLWLLLDQALAARRPAHLVLLALMLATFLSVYPLYLPILVATAGLIVLWRAFRMRRAGEALRPVLRPVALSVVAVAVMSLAFDPVAVARDVHYYKLLANNEVPFPRVGYTLPIPVIPGWITQTREFWLLNGLWSSAKAILLGVVVPFAFLVVIVIGLRRHRAAFALVVVMAIAAVIAEYSYVSQQSCTYCAERDLLSFAPIVAVLIPLGLAALLAMPGWIPRTLAIGGLAMLAVTVAERARIELKRFSESSYFFSSADRKLLQALPRGPGRVNLEGFNASVAAQAEQVLVYHYVNWVAPHRVSIIAGDPVGNAIQYLDFGAVRLPPGREFDPEYKYVVTRLPGVTTDRRVIAREPGVALEARVKPLDISPFAGLGVPLQAFDPAGVTYVQTQYPLQMYVVGRDRGRRAWARLTFQASVPVAVPKQPGVRWTLKHGTLTVCAPATGREPIRAVTLHLKADIVPGAGPAELFPPGEPLEGLTLTAMHAVTGGCTP